LTDLSIDWNGMPVADVYPSKLTDLFSAKPVVLHGRYTKSFSGVIKLRGKIAGQPYEREIAVNLPENEPANDSLASLWARTRVDEITNEKLKTADIARTAEYEKEVTNLGLEFRLLTSFTSFVAVEDRVVNQNGKPVTIQVPVEVPAGVDPVKSGAVTETVSVAGGGGGGALMNTTNASVASLPAARSVQSLVTLSSGVAQTVDVTKSKAKKQKRGSGTGTGQGYGYGTGSGSGNGNGDSDGPAMVQSVPTAKTQAEIHEAMLKAKMHNWVYALMERISKGYSKKADNESLFVRDGKASIVVDLTSVSDAVREKLRSAGFEIVSEKGLRLTGRISIEKLAALAEIDEVKLITPAA
jgi:hypothetical protein